MSQPADEASPKTPPAPRFPIVVHFKNGQSLSFEPIDINWDTSPRSGKLTKLHMDFDPIGPGELTLVYVDLNEVQAVTSFSVERPDA